MMKKQTQKQSTKSDIKKETGSPMLDRHIQKQTAERMAQANEEILAKAIKTMLYADKGKNKFFN